MIETMSAILFFAIHPQSQVLCCTCVAPCGEAQDCRGE